MEALVSGIKKRATLFFLLEWLDSIRSSLLQKAEEFVQWAPNAADVPEATCTFIKVQQLVALRRLQWLQPLFERQLHELVSGKLKPPEVLPPSEELDQRAQLVQRKRRQCCILPPSVVLDQCSQMVQRMRWQSCGNFCKILDNSGHLKDMKGRSIKAAFDIELVEEVSENDRSSCLFIGDS